jgi:hypothetical protein
MLKYDGKIYFDKPLDEQELSFLKDWQKTLVELYEEYRDAPAKSDKEAISKKINYYSGIDFNDKQRWVIFFAMSPMIHFHNDYMELKGQSKKGNMREAFMAYHHFFLGEDAVLKECMDLNFMKVHNLNGIVEAYKEDKYGDESRWCYLVENNKVFSIEVPSLKLYEDNPTIWHKVEKEDTFYQEHLLKYFPPLMEYASLKKTINKINEQKEVTKAPKRLKI